MSNPLPEYLERPPQGPPSKLTQWLSAAKPWQFSLFAIAAAFTTYFGMYAFRKPYQVATFTDQSIGGLDLKSALIISQVLGYALSKWLGVKFISEMLPHRRAKALVFLIFVAWSALLVFALAPPHLKLAAMFVNGIPLGAVWGLVFGFLEGRRTSEILGAGLSCSYIVASGAVKDVGSWTMSSFGVGESWMPFVTAAMFLPIFLLAVWLLKQIPPPTAEDIASRTERQPMHAEQRRAFIARFLPGLLALTVLYFFLTAYRDFRDGFSAEIFTELGIAGKTGIFTLVELPTPFIVMTTLALLYLIQNNRIGLLVAHGIMIFGVVMVGVGTMLYDAGLISGMAWYMCCGLSLYLAYVPYGCVLFDRMIAAVGVVATAVFMIYVTDAAGYAGAIVVILYKNFGQGNLSYLDFFRKFSYFTAVFCTACFALSAVYFWNKSRPQEADEHTGS